MRRAIVHLDADAFFASVEQAADTRLRGKPIAVGGERRGIIASASYEARKFGIYTPMPTARARKLCPRLIVLPGDYERYEQFSHWMFGYAYDFTPDVEQTSIDEGYFDLTANHEKAAGRNRAGHPPGHRPIAQNHRQRGDRRRTSWSVRLPPSCTSPPLFKSCRADRRSRSFIRCRTTGCRASGRKTAVRLNAAGLARHRADRRDAG